MALKDPETLNDSHRPKHILTLARDIFQNLGTRVNQPLIILAVCHL